MLVQGAALLSADVVFEHDFDRFIVLDGKIPNVSGVLRSGLQKT